MTIGVSQLDDSTPAIVAAQALGYLQANTVFAQLVARDWDNEVAQFGGSVTIPFLGALTANPKVGGTAVTLQSPADTAKTVILNKHPEVTFVIEDIGRTIARPDVLAGYIEDGIKVIAEEIDSDIGALYSTFLQTLDATGGLGDDDFRNARMKLNSARAPNSDRSFVLSEDAEYELLGLERFVSADFAGVGGVSSLDSARIGSYMGFNCYMNQNVNYSSNWKNLAFHKNAIVLASRPLSSAPLGAGVVQSRYGRRRHRHTCDHEL